MNWEPGLITDIDEEGMSIKVPTGLDCAACPGIHTCSFQGPDTAYRVVRVPRVEGYSVGDRLRVEQPAAPLILTALIMVALPVLLLLAGYGVVSCCMQFPYAKPTLWASGAIIWLVSWYFANRWMMRSPRFQPTLHRLVKPSEQH